ncbi:acetate and sugar kinases/Hsc70/actin family protein [Herbaspirillum camelliae]|uniref:hypothetical protein n=1 Tax=Herbaspirillum camelliae TaxID=1892903 RepID=UPI00117B6A7B|nr:hypothetical protein [Herbaspirillum camelliae]
MEALTAPVSHPVLAADVGVTYAHIFVTPIHPQPLCILAEDDGTTLDAILQEDLDVQLALASSQPAIERCAILIAVDWLDAIRDFASMSYAGRFVNPERRLLPCCPGRWNAHLDRSGSKPAHDRPREHVTQCHPAMLRTPGTINVASIAGSNTCASEALDVFEAVFAGFSGDLSMLCGTKGSSPRASGRNNAISFFGHPCCKRVFHKGVMRPFLECAAA